MNGKIDEHDRVGCVEKAISEWGTMEIPGER